MQSDQTYIVHPTTAKEFLSGDKKAFEQLYDQYAAPLYGFICRLIPDAKQADLVLQQVFLSLWQERALYSTGDIPLWAIMIKSARAIASGISQNEEILTGPQNHKDTNYVDTDTTPAMGRTPLSAIELQDKAFQLMYIGGKSLQEVAKHLDISPEEIPGIVSVAIKRFKQEKR